MKTRVLISFVVALFFSSTAIGQVPIVYYDFESNTDRNATVQNTPEATITRLSGNNTIQVTDNSTTTISVSNSGNGTSYNGTNSGYALSRSGFTTSNTSTNSTNFLSFSSFNCVGFSNLSI